LSMLNDREKSKRDRGPRSKNLVPRNLGEKKGGPSRSEKERERLASKGAPLMQEKRIKTGKGKGILHEGKKKGDAYRGNSPCYAKKTSP